MVSASNAGSHVQSAGTLSPPVGGVDKLPAVLGSTASAPNPKLPLPPAAPDPAGVAASGPASGAPPSTPPLPPICDAEVFTLGAGSSPPQALKIAKNAPKTGPNRATPGARAGLALATHMGTICTTNWARRYETPHLNMVFARCGRTSRQAPLLSRSWRWRPPAGRATSGAAPVV